MVMKKVEIAVMVVVMMVVMVMVVMVVDGGFASWERSTKVLHLPRNFKAHKVLHLPQSTAPATKSALQGSQSTAPATKS